MLYYLLTNRRLCKYDSQARERLYIPYLMLLALLYCAGNDNIRG